MFNSPSDFAQFIQGLGFRAHSVQAIGDSGGTTLASLVVGQRGVIRSFRARIIDAGTTGAANVVTLVKLPSGSATEADLASISVASGTDITATSLPEGASLNVEPGDVLKLKGPAGNGAVVAHVALDVDARFGA